MVRITILLVATIALYVTCRYRYTFQLFPLEDIPVSRFHYLACANSAIHTIDGNIRISLVVPRFALPYLAIFVMTPTANLSFAPSTCTTSRRLR